MASTKNEFDYIIAGGGMAGLSLAYYLSKSSLTSKNILIIDEPNSQPKEKTFSFWAEEDTTPFREIIEKTWSKIAIQGKTLLPNILEISPYTYSTIQSENLLKYLRAEIKKHSNFHFLQTKVKEIRFGGLGTIIETDKGDYFAKEKVFDSISPFPYDPSNEKYVKQHFIGWRIEAKFPTFKTEFAKLFDFRVSAGNPCEFMYYLPINSHTALLEHTFFSPTIQEEDYYRKKISYYLNTILGLRKEEYEIILEEKGILPMVEKDFDQKVGQKWIKIGTPGGFLKSSTGYSFTRTQELLKNLVNNLEKDAYFAPILTKSPFKKFQDKVLLQVLKNPNVNSNEIFEILFEKNPPNQVLKYLDEKTSIWEDLRIMSSVPTKIFLNGAFQVLLKKES